MILIGALWLKRNKTNFRRKKRGDEKLGGKNSLEN